MENVMKTVTDYCTDAAFRLLLALIVWLVGKALIKAAGKAMKKARLFTKLDQTAGSFARNVMITVLYIVLIISVVSILGVPMASTITVLASGAMAVSLALQGSLGNVAAGFMLLLFRPFNVGDYAVLDGNEGTVKEIGIFYTVITTPQNTEISVPNGNLMNTTIINYTANQLRRIDYKFTVSKNTDLETAIRVTNGVIERNEMTLKEPAPVVSVSDTTDTGMVVQARVWVKKENYLVCKENLIKETAQAYREKGITQPSIHVIS